MNPTIEQYFDPENKQMFSENAPFGDEWFPEDMRGLVEDIYQEYDENSSDGSWREFIEARGEYAREIDLLPAVMSVVIFDMVCRGKTEMDVASRHQIPLGAVRTLLHCGLVELDELMG